jgi:hypothetical protein
LQHPSRISQDPACEAQQLPVLALSSQLPFFSFMTQRVGQAAFSV